MNIPTSSLNRKEALKRIGWMLGGAVSAPLANALLSGLEVRLSGLTSFSAQQEKLLGRIADIMIPETDTPGATEAGVLYFISDIVFMIYNEQRRSQFFDELNRFEITAKNELGKAFEELDPEQQKTYLYQAHSKAYSEFPDEMDPFAFIRTMKELTVTGYFSSKVGMTQVLQYTQTPGEHRACITFEEAGGRVHARAR